MAEHLVLTIRLHPDAGGVARFHGHGPSAPEWPPSPARVFSALVAGAARGRLLAERHATALEWLETLAPPLIASPPRRLGQRFAMYVPNNDADAIPDPRDPSSIRVPKPVQPSLLEAGATIHYAWAIERRDAHVAAVIEAARDLFQLGRGLDMAYAEGAVRDDEALDALLRSFRGQILRAATGGRGTILPCPVAGSLASLQRRHQSPRIRTEGAGRAARVLFSNPPKPRFAGAVYEPRRERMVFGLRARGDEVRPHPWPLARVVSLVEGLRDAAAERLRGGLPSASRAIDLSLVGNGELPSRTPNEERIRIVPLPSIGHEFADRAVRRVAVEVPSGSALRGAEVEWAFSGLAPSLDQSFGPGFVLVRGDDQDPMVGRYAGRARRWCSVTPLALPAAAARRRIDPTRRREEAKGGTELLAEQDRSGAALATALRHAGIRASLVDFRVQREPFEGRGVRAESFASATRFAKERLWHAEIVLDDLVDGPLVLGDGRFLGLGLMAPADDPAEAAGGILGFDIGPVDAAQAGIVARALRRTVMSRVQAVLGDRPLGVFFSGHEEDGGKATSERAEHLAFHADPARGRAFVIAPHRLDRRGPTVAERHALAVLEEAVRELAQVRAGRAGLLSLTRIPVPEDDPVARPARRFVSVTPYAVTRHPKHASAAETVRDDVVRECARRGLPTPAVVVHEAYGIPGQGTVGRVELHFAALVPGPLALGRTRFLGGGLLRALDAGREGPDQGAGV